MMRWALSATVEGRSLDASDAEELRVEKLRQDRAASPSVVEQYARAHLGRTSLSIATSLVPFLALWAAMYFSLSISYLITLALAVPTAGFLVRTYILFHDCAHGSLLRTRRANAWFGSALALIFFTPFARWRHEHVGHHATAGDLDRRGIGDVTTLTVKEYLALPWHKRLGYRLYRHPLVMLVLGPTFLFLVGHRLVSPGAGKRERDSVLWTNAALLAITLVLSWAIGPKPLLLVHLPILLLSSTAGVWLFYVQHQFETTTWEHNENWDYARAALYGSSFYRLPKILQWFTGNIGFHHIHHLSPKIPNYELQKCHEENPVFHEATTLTLLASLKSLTLRLWDEEQKKMVGFGYLKRLPEGSTPA